MLIDQIKRHEGFRSKPYQCTSGVWTFGYGMTYITEEEADMLLRLRILDLRSTLDSTIGHLSQSRQDVLVNMAFNLGIHGLSQFRKMWAAIDRKDFESAANEILDSKYAQQVGNRAIELAEQMRRG